MTLASLRIEAGVLRAGINPFSSPDAPVDVPIAGMTADHALQLLRLHRCLPRRGRRTGRPPTAMSFEEACGLLDQALARHVRQEARREARAAKRVLRDGLSTGSIPPQDER